ncbi:Phosphoglycerate dehydrogenase [Sphingomonas guangdongensis]|uniref:Phosphoglycerate dehydrogenase n=1 Tax=Sphingomonas guangdongensis TaxID=1141890 RepID=A0A285R700_9SPHN|nr:D-2-hydroxyacid dehydrogenase [Sphingomonas guangdongensis]SOB88137.1 Phosphoglycerate dehydrogenase [Sphingomonas guangdongensis]
MKAVLPALARPLLEADLPGDLDVHWFTDRASAEAAIADADIAWVDQQSPADTAAIVAQATTARWVSTIYAGVDAFDLGRLAARGTMLTNGTGINAAAVADYAVMGVLVAAKRFDQVVRQADRREWTTAPPGSIELDGSRALVIGYGTIGRLIGARLAAFGVVVTGVTRSGRDGTLGPDDWRPHLPASDWVILAAPGTSDTAAMIGAAELAAMRPEAWLINMARGDMVDQDALIAALLARRIGGAFLDTVTPEPLPADHPLWQAPGVIHSLHLSGRSQRSMFAKAAQLFLANLAAFRTGAPLANQVDLQRGY